MLDLAIVVVADIQVNLKIHGAGLHDRDEARRVLGDHVHVCLKVAVQTKLEAEALDPLDPLGAEPVVGAIVPVLAPGCDRKQSVRQDNQQVPKHLVYTISQAICQRRSNNHKQQQLSLLVLVELQLR